MNLGNKKNAECPQQGILRTSATKGAYINASTMSARKINIRYMLE